MQEQPDERALIEAAFPTLPFPDALFSIEAGRDRHFREDFIGRIGRRAWTQVTMHDWTMLDFHPATARSNLTPSTFIYYLPSLLLGCLSDMAYVDHALEATMPSNRARRPKGQWWFAFVEELTAVQRVALAAYVELVRLLLLDSNDAVGLAYALEATAIWPPKV
jgi:hypothetical protein